MKELLENSIDANSSSIKVVAQEGGWKNLSVIDNGDGIPVRLYKLKKEDFPLVCERFATSKITKYSDLSKIISHGFRGEALTSLSFVADLKIISKISTVNLAVECSFRDGKPITDLQFRAGNQGTNITVNSTQ